MTSNEDEFFFEVFDQFPGNDGNQQNQEDKVNLASKQNCQQFQQTQRLTKQQKKKKGEYLKSLHMENKQLRNLIIELEKKISTKEAENTLLQNQLTFFNQQLPPSTDH